MQYTENGFTVSAITEIEETKNGFLPRLLYVTYGFLTESMAEQGLPIPADMAEAMGAAGICPVLTDFS